MNIVFLILFTLATLCQAQNPHGIPWHLTGLISGGGGSTDDSTYVDLTITNELILPLDADAATPTIRFGDGDTGFHEGFDDRLEIAQAGTNRWYFTSSGSPSGYFSSWGDQPTLWATTASSTVPNITTSRGDNDTGVGSAGANILSLIAGATERFQVNSTGAALVSGNLGIRTTSPGAPLHIDADGGDTDGEGVKYYTPVVSTTDASATTWFTLSTDSDHIYWIDAIVIGVQDDNTNEYYNRVAFKVSNVSGTVTEDSETDYNGQEDDNSTGSLADIAGTVSGTNYLLQVTGIALENWKWTGKIEVIAIGQ